MKKRLHGIVILGVILVILMACIFLSTSAEMLIDYTDSSQSHVYAYGNAYYTYWSRISRIGSSLMGGTLSKCNRSVPIGYIGEAGRIYQERESDPDILVNCTAMTYNSEIYSADTAYYVYSLWSAESGKYYYSRGLTKYYNGNGYDGSYICTRTANMGAPSSKTGESDDGNKGNRKSDYSPGNLSGKNELYVLVQGENGQIGYGKIAELEGEQPNNPEEAMEYMRRLREDYENGVVHAVPVYAEDLVTVIDSFVISYPVFERERRFYDLSGHEITDFQEYMKNR